MKRSAIRVIKRKDIGKKFRVAAKTTEVLASTDQKMEETIDGWIDELNENKAKERVFSSNKIFSWELAPKTTEKVKG